MTNFPGWGGRMRGLFTDTKGPWGSSSGGNDGDGDPPPGDGPGDGPVGGPWGEEPPRRNRRPTGANVASLDDLLRRGRMRFGRGGGGLPDRSVVLWALAGFFLLWLVVTSVHSISPGQRGVVTRFGRYSYTLGPGVGITLPSPVDRVKKIDVEN